MWCCQPKIHHSQVFGPPSDRDGNSLVTGLSLSSKGFCMRQEGHSFLQASPAEDPGKPEDGPLKVLQITHLITLPSPPK